jgi:hypothetical protein
MVFDAHSKAFEFLGGVPRRGIYGNLKPAVDVVFVGRGRRYNRRFLMMCHHYLVDPTACTPAAGWEKGQVENQVGNVREWLFTPKVRCADLAELNAHLAARCVQLAHERNHPEFAERKIAEVWDEERVALRATPIPFDGFAEKAARISATSLVNKDWNLPAALTRLRERLAKHEDGDRQFVEILSMTAVYGLEAVTEACAAAQGGWSRGGWWS